MSVWTFYRNDSNNGTFAVDLYAVRPSVYLKPSIQIIDGNGTENSPYVLGKSQD